MIDITGRTLTQFPADLEAIALRSNAASRDDLRLETNRTPLEILEELENELASIKAAMEMDLSRFPIRVDLDNILQANPSDMSPWITYAVPVRGQIYYAVKHGPSGPVVIYFDLDDPDGITLENFGADLEALRDHNDGNYSEFSSLSEALDALYDEAK